jgi:serine/threonine protein kinase
MKLTVEEKINESSFTCVYRAFDTVLQRRVLLKVLHKHLASDPDIHQRFLREARACAALRSEHIVQVYELIEYEGAPAILMEYVEGASLKNLIAEGKTQSLKFTRKVALHTLRGLVAAHAKGIIHRDIKPGNILVTGDGTLKVSDFGLASVAFVPTVTTQGMVLGTPAYMSPEQIRHEEIDQRSDLFSLGATLIEVLTGDRLFDGNSYAECAKKILTFKADALDHYAEQSSPEFVQFLKLLMSPQKKDRFASSNDALHALDRNDSNILISQPQASSSMKQRAAIIGVFLFMLCAIVISFFLYYSQSHIHKPSQKMAASDTTQSFMAAQTEPLKNSDIHPGKQPIRKQNLQVQKTAMANSGFVLITSTPWAKVYIDTVLIGETPFSHPLTLSTGMHSVMFMHPAFEPILKTINVQPHKQLHVAGNFIENTGYLKCIASPWAEIYIDEQYKDTTPLEKPIMLSPGFHLVRFKNSSFTDIVRKVTIKTKDTCSLSVSFQEKQ